MSLQVPAALLDRAKAGPVTDEDFIACVRDSLPYAWKVVSQVADRLHQDGGQYADDNTVPATDAEQGQLLRALASSSMRGALERHFGVKLEFQNCCKVAAFRPDAVNSPTHQDFVSPRAQLLNQSPQLLSC
ncbi:SCO5389 family protein [Planosporangium sp. 12N6]|uniref:SCO5389 family protein n=1 Tax=Planosporangium spinosum TaxID=3402278 RepID=UPI003CF0616C